MLAVDSLTDIILNQTNPGEPAINLTTSQFTIAVQKHFSAKFPGTRLVLPNQITEFIVPRKLKSIEGPFVSSKVSGPTISHYLHCDVLFAIRMLTVLCIKLYVTVCYGSCQNLFDFCPSY